MAELTAMTYRLLAALTVVLMLGCSTHGDASVRLRYWNELLSQELPMGSSKGEVEAFFSRYGLETGFYRDERAVLAMDHDVQTSSVVSTSIQFRCQLDLAGLLKACATRLIHTGP